MVFVISYNWSSGFVGGPGFYFKLIIDINLTSWWKNNNRFNKVLVRIINDSEEDLLKSNNRYMKKEQELRIVILTKVSDDSFKLIGEKHPNGIYEGYVTGGIESSPPTIGERYCVGAYFSTSRVVRIIDLNNFETEYSTYHVEYKK